MKLFKNVDICDLENILQQGILSLDECGNNNWDDDKRANNRTDVVYLFKPLGKENSFPVYGVALVEVDVEALENSILNNDAHRNDYIEYTISRVVPEEIKAIYIPEIFRGRVNLPINIESRIIWCGFTANHYTDDEFVVAPTEIINQFAKTAPIMYSGVVNFFRGIKENREIIDFYNVEYIF